MMNIRFVALKHWPDYEGGDPVEIGRCTEYDAAEQLIKEAVGYALKADPAPEFFIRKVYVVKD